MTLTLKQADQEILENIRNAALPVIIFGSGIVGEALFYACCKAGIRVESFCDNNINKTRVPVCNTEVIHTPDLKKKYDNAIFFISAADIKDVVGQLNALGYSEWYDSSLLLRDFDLSQCRFSAPADFVEFAVGTCLLCHDSYSQPDKLFLRSLDIIITERCSLKCRDCSNLMQYYKTPQNCDTGELVRSIDTFCSFIDEANEFRVIGGEPFMNKEIHLIIKRLVDEPKVKKVVIYTNGTIIPNENQIEYLKDKKILLLITDYGALSKKMEELTKILLRNNIVFYARKAQGWTDCATMTRHYRDIESQKGTFKNCCAKNLDTLSDGRLYRCPFSANAARLQSVPDFKNDYVDIIRGPQEGMDIHVMKDKVRAFLLEKDFLETCDYCNGRPFDAPEIPPAIQTGRPLEYERCGKNKE